MLLHQILNESRTKILLSSMRLSTTEELLKIGDRKISKNQIGLLQILFLSEVILIQPNLENLPPLKNHENKMEIDFRDQLNRLKAEYQMQRLKGDAENRKIKMHPNYQPPIDNSDYQFPRSPKQAKSPQMIKNRPLFKSRMVLPPPSLISSNPSTYLQLDPIYFQNPYYLQYITPPGTQIRPSHSVQQFPRINVYSNNLLKADTELTMKDRLIKDLNGEIHRLKNYTSIYDQVYNHM